MDPFMKAAIEEAQKGLDNSECIELIRSFIAASPELSNEDTRV